MKLNGKLMPVLLIIQIAAIAALGYSTIYGADKIAEKDAIWIHIDILCMTIASIFSLSIILSKKSTTEAKSFYMILFFDVMHLMSDAGFLLVDNYPRLRALHIAVNTIYIICPLFITVSYWEMLKTFRGLSAERHACEGRAIKYIALAGVLLALANVFFNFYFGVNNEGQYYRGDLYLVTILVPLLMIIICVKCIIGSDIQTLDKLFLLSYPGIPIAAALLQFSVEGSSFLTIAIFISVVMLYANIYFSRESRFMELENKLAVTRLHALEMQINPHMMFNTLSSIAGMCDIDPGKAQEMIFKLSDYLRDSFTDIDKPAMVTFRDELDYLDHYIAIETMRFPRITVVKIINADNFMLPRMSLQPLVENAIKHGICKRRKAEGTITIKAFEEEHAWVVKVEDDGVGFDSSILTENTDGHHGIYNVRTRLAILCGGTLEVAGDPGNGAVSTIRIPKDYRGGYRS